MSFYQECLEDSKDPEDQLEKEKLIENVEKFSNFLEQGILARLLPGVQKIQTFSAGFFDFHEFKYLMKMNNAENKEIVIRKSRGVNYFYIVHFFDEKSDYIKYFPIKHIIGKKIENDVLKFVPMNFKVSSVEFKYNSNLNYLNVRYEFESF